MARGSNLQSYWTLTLYTKEKKSLGDFSLEGGGTLPKIGYKPSQDLWEANLQMRIISAQRLARSFGTNRQRYILLHYYKDCMHDSCTFQITVQYKKCNISLLINFLGKKSHIFKCFFLGLSTRYTRFFSKRAKEFDNFSIWNCQAGKF